MSSIGNCVSSCIAIDEHLNGKADSDIALLEIQRNYIANKSQYVDEEDLDIRLGRSNYAFSEIGGAYSGIRIFVLKNVMLNLRGHTSLWRSI